MLYKFKSKAAADLIMLEPNGRHLLTILGKDQTDSLRRGILRPAEMPHAIELLEAAVHADEARQQQAADEARERGEDPERPQGVSLRQRVAPFIEMLRHCLREDEDLVWGV